MSMTVLGLLAVVALVAALVMVGIVLLALWLVRRSSAAEQVPAARASQHES